MNKTDSFQERFLLTLDSDQTSKLIRSMLKSPLGLSHKVVGFLPYAGGIVFMSVLFMVPSLVQSSFLAQQQKNVALQTYGAPISFGGIVMQLPDSAIALENAMASQFIYYGIPVKSPDD